MTEKLEPWLRGTLSDLPSVKRGVLHALELAQEDVEHWCADFNTEELNARPFGIASVAFHIRHIARSLDRLLTYAEERSLTPQQLEALQSEMSPDAMLDVLFEEFRAALNSAEKRVRAFNPARFDDPRYIGRKRLPTTLGGLLVHVADHTQRHVGQAVTTAKILRAERSRR
jgi:uncharacterized damage-inducible protein DinB